MSGHILVVEDDEHIARMIETTLALGGYTSELCLDGIEAVRRMRAGTYDLVLLDVMLPGMDGFSVFEQQGEAQTPVIFLTAMDSITDKVRGLKMGAEDYLTKPFEAMELLVRIEVVLRRTQRDVPTTLGFRDIQVDVERHLVSCAGEPVALTPKEFDLLVFFIRNVDIALTRERLLSLVWGYGYMGETRTVDTHVQQIRKKLGLSDALVTIPRLGYRLESSLPERSSGMRQSGAREAYVREADVRETGAQEGSTRESR